MAERVTEIYSLLVPLVEGRLIIPRACVAEVIGFQTPSEMTGGPPWYIATLPWNGKAVPLVRVSADVVRPDNSRVFGERMPVICQIRMINETPLVPDLERLEEMIADEASSGA